MQKETELKILNLLHKWRSKVVYNAHKCIVVLMLTWSDEIQGPAVIPSGGDGAGIHGSGLIDVKLAEGGLSFLLRSSDQQPSEK